MAATTTSFLSNESDNNSIVFLIVPFPAQSHLNQSLRLSHLIFSRGFPVHYAASVTHCRQVKLRHEASASEGIIFHELLTPTKPPSSVEFPDHLIPSLQTSVNSRQPVAALIRELSSSAATRRLVIIHDTLMTYVVQDSASIPNAECYSLNCGSIFSTFCFTCQFTGKPFPLELHPKAIPTADNFFTPEVVKFLDTNSGLDGIIHGKLYNTCRAIEDPCIDILAETEVAENQWAIAPLFPVIVNHNHNHNHNHNQDKNKAHPTLEWLEKQPPKSVIYVSFGSTTTMSNEQIIEIALGLEQSKQRFLWVLRDSDRLDIFNGETRILHLPEGFEERIEGVGKVTRDWAPQLGILRHPSVGGFMSHCGWNSCLESLAMGVPLATWPMHFDQPYNALLITNVLKVGVPVIGWGERDEPVKSSTIKKSIESLLASREGDAIRIRVEELGKVIEHSVEEDATWELNSFLAYAARLDQ